MSPDRIPNFVQMADANNKSRIVFEICIFVETHLIMHV